MKHGRGGRGIILMVAMLLAGCASHPRTNRRAAWSVFRGAHHADVGRPASYRARARGAQADESAELVVERLHAAGFRFGTDGTPGALWGYMRTSHELVDAGDARAGDVVFFDTRSRQESELSCADRVGIVESAEPAGRITFVEARAGQLHRGFVDPHLPLVRRDERGEILNSFLRAKRLGDPEGTRYFAGEMLCGVTRMRSR